MTAGYVLFMALGGLVIAFQIFCNGVICGEVSEKQKAAEEEKSFDDLWEEMVEDAQWTRSGKIGMKVYYFIPTIISCICRSKCHRRETTNPTY